MPNTEHDQYTEIFDAGHSGKEHTVHQRIRANSAVMELKKILGASLSPSFNVCFGAWQQLLILRICSHLQWLIEGKYVSSFHRKTAVVEFTNLLF